MQSSGDFARKEQKKRDLFSHLLTSQLSAGVVRVTDPWGWEAGRLKLCDGSTVRAAGRQVWPQCSWM